MRLSRPAALVLVTVMSLSVAMPASAAQRQAPSPRDGTAVSTVAQVDADDTRRQLEDLLKVYPPSLPRILRMDPTLVNNEAYLQPYPVLATFLNQHPEIRHNPMYFF